MLCLIDELAMWLVSNSSSQQRRVIYGIRSMCVRVLRDVLSGKRSRNSFTFLFFLLLVLIASSPRRMNLITSFRQVEIASLLLFSRWLYRQISTRTTKQWSIDLGVSNFGFVGVSAPRQLSLHASFCLGPVRQCQQIQRSDSSILREIRIVPQRSLHHRGRLCASVEETDENLHT